MVQTIRSTAMAAAAFALLAGAAGPAYAEGPGDALKLRRLDMMLMVTSLRCRTTDADFQEDFKAFEAAHIVALDAAARDLRAGYTAGLGRQGADRALDRLSVAMANDYGAGHPYLDCAQLKAATRDLAAATEPPALLAAADQLLASEAPRFAENTP